MMRIVTLGLLLLLTTVCHSHSPHDVINVLRISDSPAQDTLFIVVSHKLILRSLNGGRSWKEINNGLDNRYNYTDIRASKGDNRSVVFVATDGDGIYRSDNGGEKWHSLRNNLPDGRIKHLHCINNGNNALLAAGTVGGLYLSENGGQSWLSVMDKSVVVSALAGLGPMILAGDDRGYLYLSPDSGRHWEVLTRISGAGSITAISSFRESDILVGTANGGLYKTKDGGKTFEETGIEIPDGRITAITTSANKAEESGVAFVSTWDKAVYKSVDEGERWGLHRAGLTTDPQARKRTHYSPQFGDIAIASNGTLFLGAFDGLFRSTDQGNRWEQIATLDEGRIVGLAVSPGRNSELVALTTYGGGAYLLDLGSGVWEIRNYGLGNPRLTDIQFSPEYDNDGVLITAAPGELLKTTRLESRWSSTKLEPGLLIKIKRKLVSILQRLGIPSAVASSILKKNEKTQPFPTKITVGAALGSQQTVLIGTRQHGILKSLDGAESYTTILASDRMVSSVKMSPDYPNDYTIYASARQRGVLRSQDGGKSWIPINAGLDFIQRWEKVASIDERNLVELDRSLYYDIHLAISPAFKDDATLFAASGEGLYKSTNRGEHWIRKKVTSNNIEQILEIAVSPDYKTDNVIMVSVKGQGIHISQDGGESFAPRGVNLQEDNQEIRYLQFTKPYSIGTLVAASSESIFYSRDKGYSWEQITRPVRIEDKRERIQCFGQWKTVVSKNYSAGSAKRAQNQDSKAKLSFWGNGIRWVGEKSPSLALAAVVIDNGAEQEIDQYLKESLKSTVIFEKTGLASGLHTIEIRGEVVLDAFDILGGS